MLEKLRWLKKSQLWTCSDRLWRPVFIVWSISSLDMLRQKISAYFEVVRCINDPNFIALFIVLECCHFNSNMLSFKFQGSLSILDMAMLQACWLPEDCLEEVKTLESTPRMRTLRQKSTERPKPSQYQQNTLSAPYQNFYFAFLTT